MPDFYEYEIEGKKYKQRRLTLIQTKQLSTLLREFQWPEKITETSIMYALAGNLSKVLAIVLIPCEYTVPSNGNTNELTVVHTSLEKREDVKKALRAKDIDKLAEEFDYVVDTNLTTLALEAIKHFLVCNHLLSVFEEMGIAWEMVEQQVTGKEKAKKKPTG